MDNSFKYVFLLSASDTDAHGKATITLSGATTVTAIIIGGRMTDSIVDFAKNIFADWVFIYRFGKYIGMR
ncbi:hypothetical protein MXH02_004042 [Salmonella enterica]|nr:hypothetical protein [Salmonella enterica]